MSGWHFAYWDWRNLQNSWNLENFGEEYWDAVLNSFNEGMEVNDNYSGKINFNLKFNGRYLELQSDERISSVAIYDIIGNEIINTGNLPLFQSNYSKEGFNYQLKFSEYPSGIYFLKVNNSQSTEIQKFVIIK